MANEWGIGYKLKALLPPWGPDIPDAHDSKAYTNQVISDVQQKAIDSQDASKHKPQLLPKDLLKDAVKIGKDEINKAIVDVINKKAPVVAGGTTTQWGTISSVPTTTMNWDGTINTAITTYSGSGGTGPGR